MSRKKNGCYVFLSLFRILVYNKKLMIKQIIKRIINFQIPRFETEDHIRIRISNITALLGTSITLFYSILFTVAFRNFTGGCSSEVLPFSI